jgi:hypothetical protein
MKSGQIIPLILGTLALTGGALAQDRKPISIEEKRRMVVSVRAGEVNLVEGDVSVKSGNSKSDQDWSLLVPGDVVKEGDAVKTGPGSRAEVLLNPGSYLRLSENSEFKFDSTSIDSIKINLLKGAAIVEAVAGGASVLATVITPNAQFSIARAGVYRFNVDDSGRTEAQVTKGRLTTGTLEVREGREVVVGDAGSELVAVDKRPADTFDAWSKDRAKSLVEANANLARSDVNLFQARSGLGFGSGLWSPLWSSRFGWFGSCTGLWYFDPFFGSFLYLPDTFWGCSALSSPYGYPYQCGYYPPRGGYVEEPGEGSGTPHHKHPKQHPGPEPAVSGHKHGGSPAIPGGALGHHGSADRGLGHPTIGHSSPGFGSSHASAGHSSGGGSFSSGGHASAGHASSSSSTASSAPASSGGGHHH